MAVSVKLEWKVTFSDCIDDGGCRGDAVVRQVTVVRQSVETWARTTLVAGGEIRRDEGVSTCCGDTLGYGIEADCSLLLLMSCIVTERTRLECRVTLEQMLDCLGIETRKSSAVQDQEANRDD